MGSSTRTAILTALLCLGEFRGKRRDGVPSSSRSWSLKDFRTEEAQWGQNFGGSRNVLIPRSDPTRRGLDQAWSIYVWVGVPALTGNSLPGLCHVLWNQVQAGESSPHLLLQPNEPCGQVEGAQRVWAEVTTLGGALSNTWAS